LEYIVKMPEIEIKIKVNICSRCHHLWERRKRIGDGDNQPMVCPNCNSPYWNTTRVRGKGKKKKLLPLRFHGEEVLDSNFDKICGK
jgi:hypothetical protein